MAYYYTKTSIKMTNLTIAYNLGGLFDQEGQKGISHLMEHLICKTFKDEYGDLNKYNIEWNAITGGDCVKIYFMGMDKYFTPE
jgi:predicted Zn-dependent peptidase